MPEDDIKKKLKTLSKTIPHLKELLTESRLKQYISKSETLDYHYAFSQVTAPILETLKAYSEEQNILHHFQEMKSGAIINKSENRAASHLSCRDPKSNYFQDHQAKALRLGNQVFENTWKTENGNSFETIIQIGIGGSELGPKAVYHGLDTIYESSKKALFIASIDPTGFHHKLRDCNLETALIVIVSKSGSTFETQENIKQLKRYIENKSLSWDNFQQQILIITCPNSKLDQDKIGEKRLYMQESIGGRFSVTSPVGTFLLSACFGSKMSRSFLEGAYEMDLSANKQNLEVNPPLCAALVSWWERVFLNYKNQGIMAYSHALSIIPSHLQQLFCESLGKRHNYNNQILEGPSGKLIFGEEGPNAQHSFFQLLHQGNESVPIQFLGVRNSFHNGYTDFHEGLSLSMAAQMIALSEGKYDENPAQHFDGNRPSSLVLLEQLSARHLGALVSFYENMVFFEGLLLNINTFDQPGVELGKSVLSTLEEKQGLLQELVDLLK
tara:strand:+ start:1110 stop:2603 length:1494 start_codon:yes stop_codon:yes gene_type:complete